MHLIITSHQRLGERLGAWELRRTQSRLLELHNTRQQRGLRSKIVSVETGMPERGIAGVNPRDPLAVRDLVLLLDQEIGPLESVLIVGGPQIMPFHACTDPLGEDERSIPSDHPYSVRDASSLLSDWAVARLPAESASVLLRLLLLANRAQHAVPRQLHKFFAYSSATWQTTSRLVLEEAGMIAPLVSAPPTGATSLDLQMLESADRIYCNLHGINDGPFWYGQATGARGAVVVALRPQDVAALDMRGSVVVSEACFGAYADGYNFDESIAMRFLLRGASCFVGATALAYGAPLPPLAEADLFAAAFLRASLRPGVSAGAAFQQARRDLIRHVIASQGFIDEETERTLLQFVMYADPTIVITRDQPV